MDVLQDLLATICKFIGFVLLLMLTSDWPRLLPRLLQLHPPNEESALAYGSASALGVLALLHE